MIKKFILLFKSFLMHGKVRLDEHGRNILFVEEIKLRIKDKKETWKLHYEQAHRHLLMNLTDSRIHACFLNT